MALMLVIGFASGANALTLTGTTSNVGYEAVWFEFTSADIDSAVKKIVVFWGTSPTTMVRMDSLTTVTAPGDTIKTSRTTGLFQNGTQYYWYAQSTDSVTSDLRYPALYSNAAYPYNPYLTFTTTDLLQNNKLLYDGYSTAGIKSDTTTITNDVHALFDSVRLHLAKTATAATYKASITTVTQPDTFAITGLDEGVTYYYKTIAYIADSSVVDTSAIGKFTTTDLQIAVNVLSSTNSSVVLKIDTVNAYAAFDSVELQWGAGTGGITSDSIITTVTSPDTFTMNGFFEGSTYYYRVLGFCNYDDSAGVESTTVASFSTDHNALIESLMLDRDYLGRNYKPFLNWDFDNTADNYTTGKLPIKTNWMRVHAIIDGEDDAHTFDSLQVFLWTWVWGDSIIIDTISAMENDTATITPLKYRMSPNTDYSDTSLVLHPPYNWGQFFSISAVMTDSSGTYDIGTRGVHVIVEEIE